MIRLRSLGTTSLQNPEGIELDAVLTQPKRFALLLYLAVATPRGLHRRDRLLAIFWPESDEKHARGALNKAVHFLRQALGVEVIRTRGKEELGVNPDALWCDAWAFEAALSSGELERAVELYRGELLAGFHLPEVESWLDATRAHYARLFVDALERLARQRERQGDRKGAVEAWRKLVEVEPLQSRAVLGLMRALAAVGERPRAIQQAIEYAALIEQELGADPDLEVIQLAEHLRRDLLAVQAGADLPALTGQEHTGAAAGAPSPDPAPPAKEAACAGDEAQTRAPTSDLDDANTAVARWSGSALHRGLMVRTAAVLAIVGLAWASHRNAGDVAPTERSLAVLPLEDLGPKPEAEYLASALHNELIAQLGRCTNLRVISRHSVRHLTDDGKTLSEIAEALGVGMVLHGSVLMGDRRVRVNVQLIEPHTERQLWAEHYDREVIDAFELQEDIVRSVVGALRTQLEPPTASTTSKPPSSC